MNEGAGLELVATGVGVPIMAAVVVAVVAGRAVPAPGRLW